MLITDSNIKNYRFYLKYKLGIDLSDIKYICVLKIKIGRLYEGGLIREGGGERWEREGSGWGWPWVNTSFTYIISLY